MPRAKAFDTKLLERMGISRQSLYDTYGDKHSLFLAALDRYREGVRAELHGRLSGQAPAFEQLRGVFDWATREIFEHPEHQSCFMANAALELGQRDPEVRERVARHLQDIEGWCRRRSSAAKQRGSWTRATMPWRSRAS